MVILEWILYGVGLVVAYYAFRWWWWLYPKQISKWKRYRMSEYDFYKGRIVTAVSAAAVFGYFAIAIVYTIFHSDKVFEEKTEEYSEVPASVEVAESEPEPLVHTTSGDILNVLPLPEEAVHEYAQRGDDSRNRQDYAEESDATEAETIDYMNVPPLTEEEAQKPRETVEKVVERWDDAHNRQDDVLFKVLYASKVLYYGQQLTSKRCVKDKQRLFQQYNEFSQHSVNLRMEDMGEGRMKVAFDKQVSFDGQEKTYPSYLVLKRDVCGKWRIEQESDEITDRNLERKRKGRNERCESQNG